MKRSVKISTIAGIFLLVISVVLCITYWIFLNSISGTFCKAVGTCISSGSYVEFDHAGYTWTIDYIPNGTDEMIDSLMNTIRKQSEAYDEVQLNKSMMLIGYFPSHTEAVVYYRTRDGVVSIAGGADAGYSTTIKDSLREFFDEMDSILYWYASKL